MSHHFALKPLRIGQILDRTIQLYRANFWKLLGISALLQVPLAILSYFVISSSFQNIAAVTEVMGGGDPLLGIDSLSTSSSLSNLYNILTLIATQLTNAALITAVAAILFGRNISILDSFRNLKSRLLSLIGAGFVSFVLTIMLLLATLILLLTIVGWLAALGALIFFGLAVSIFIVPMIMLEEASATDAIVRAWNLASRRFWRVLSFSLVLSIFTYALMFGPIILVIVVVSMFLFDGSMSEDIIAQALTSIIITTVGLSLVNILIVPIRSIVSTLFYFDMRVREEGLDLFLATADPNTDMYELIKSAPKIKHTSMMNKKEIGRYFMLSGGCIGVYILLVLLIVALIFVIAFLVSETT